MFYMVDLKKKKVKLELVCIEMHVEHMNQHQYNGME